MFRHALLALALLGLLAGCGRHEHPSAAPGGELTFEQLDRLRDTTGLSAGAALLRHFEPYRLPNHVMRVRGEMNLPDGTVLQIAVFPPGSHAAVARVQFELRGHRFDTPPIMGSRGPLPQDRYHFEMITFFDSSSLGL